MWSYFQYPWLFAPYSNSITKGEFASGDFSAFPRVSFAAASSLYFLASLGQPFEAALALNQFQIQTLVFWNNCFLAAQHGPSFGVKAVLLYDSFALTKTNYGLFVCWLLDAQISPESGGQVHFVLECVMVVDVELNHSHLRFWIHM